MITKEKVGKRAGGFRFEGGSIKIDFPLELEIRTVSAVLRKIGDIYLVRGLCDELTGQELAQG